MENSPQSNFGVKDEGTKESLTGAVKAELSEMAEPLKGKAQQLAEEQKEAGTSHIRTIATAVHGAARELEPGMPGLANSVHDVARRIESAADDIRHRNVDELLEKFDRYSRQQPAVVFGGALAAGFILSRFLKSSASGSKQPSGNSQASMQPASDGEAGMSELQW